jgi:hypothetical protein
VAERCTWVDCVDEAKVKHLDRDGKPWAHLCCFHSGEMDDAADIGSPSWKPGALMRCWIRAQGGAKAAADRMTRRA